MKELIKKVIPTPLLQASLKAFHQINPFDEQKDNLINTPVATQYTGDAESVLQCCIAYNKYGGYCVPSSSLHRPATQKILLGEVWEHKTLEFMLEHCGTKDIIHAGTYFGDFLPALSKACAPNAKIWAFEPQPENYRCAVMTTFLNNLDNVKLENAGLGSQVGSMPMLVTDRIGQPLGGASRIIDTQKSLKEQIIVKEQLIEVKILKIDDVVPIDREVSILQLDVEGFEQQALMGAIKTIQRTLPILIVETLPDEAWLSENIYPLGYQIQGKVHSNTILTI